MKKLQRAQILLQSGARITAKQGSYVLLQRDKSRAVNPLQNEEIIITHRGMYYRKVA